MKMTDYLNKLINAYNENKSKHTALMKDIEVITAEFKAAKSSGNLSQQGLNNLQKNYEEEKAGIFKKIQGLKDDFNNTASKIREEADKSFGELYRILPERLDMNAVEILKSGILTDTELMELANKYSDNRTMTRYIAKYAMERAEKDHSNIEFVNFAYSLKDEETAPHLTAIDTLTKWGENALAKDSVHSTAYANHFEEQAEEIINTYGYISNDNEG